jgi:hypothetical protein
MNHLKIAKIGLSKNVLDIIRLGIRRDFSITQIRDKRIPARMPSRYTAFPIFK